MAILTNITGSSWPASGAATSGSTGLETISVTGGTFEHVASTDLPDGSLSASYVQAELNRVVTIAVDSFAEILAATGELYGFSFWMRLWKVGEPVNLTAHSWLDVNGNGIRNRLLSYSRPTGMTAFFSPTLSAGASTENLNQLGASGGPALIPYDQWVRMRLEYDLTVGDFSMRWFVNDMLVSKFTGASTDGTADINELNQIAISANACRVQIAGPIVSYDQNSETVKPLVALRSRSSQLTKYVYGMSWATDDRGSCWTPAFTGSTVATDTAYGSSGIIAKRTRPVLAGAGTASYTSIDVGTLPFNESGWCSIAFPMLYLGGAAASTITVQLRNAADDGDLVSLTLNGTNIVDNNNGGASVFSMNRTSRYALILHLSNAGEAKATLLNQSATSSPLSSAALSSFTPGAAGAVKLSAVVASSDEPEIDGCLIGPYIDIVGVDSIASAANASVSPSYYVNNHVTQYLPLWFRSIDQIPGCPEYDSSDSHSCIIAGRPGLGTSYFKSLTDAMTDTRAVRIVRIDGGSINDLSGVNAGNTDSVLESWKSDLRDEVSKLVKNGNRVLLSTMIRREQGTYTDVQLIHINRRNAFIVQLAEELQTSVGGQSLIEVADAATEIGDHVTLFTSGDDIHFNAAGDALYAEKVGDASAPSHTLKANLLTETEIRQFIRTGKIPV